MLKFLLLPIMARSSARSSEPLRWDEEVPRRCDPCDDGVLFLHDMNSASLTGSVDIAPEGSHVPSCQASGGSLSSQVHLGAMPLRHLLSSSELHHQQLVLERMKKA